MPGSVQILTVHMGASFLVQEQVSCAEGGLGEESGAECAEFRAFRDSFLAGGVGRFCSSSVGDESADLDSNNN